MAAPTAKQTAAAAASKAADRKALDLALSAINKTYGEGTLMRMGDAAKMKVETVSTGSVAIDLCLGVGGLPKGRIVEIYGPESSGKTTLCLSIIAEAQRKGGSDAIVLDSVAALVSKQELDGQMGDSTVGVQARMMSQAMRRLTAAISKSQCL